MRASHSINYTYGPPPSIELAWPLPTPTSPKKMNCRVSGYSCKLNSPYTLLPKCFTRQFLPRIPKSGEHFRQNHGPATGIWAFPEVKFQQRRIRRGGCTEREKWVVLGFSSSGVRIEGTQISNTEETACRVKLQSLNGCKLGIGRYPDFEYNAEGGGGEGTAENLSDGKLAVNFDVQRLYIPPLTYQTTKFLGLPLPPFLSIGIAPENFQGFIEPGTGKVELNFRAKFFLSAGSLYKPPPLLVETILTTEASNGDLRSGRGQRLDSEGFCRLVGVATVVPIDDSLINAFLGLPTECLADMSARIQALT